MVKQWLWRFVFVSIAVVLTVGVYRLSYESFRALFTGQLLDYSTAFSYPEPQVSIQDLGDDISVFATLLVSSHPDPVSNAALPESLFIRVLAGDIDILSPDSDRINGYPFLSTVVPKSPDIRVEFLHRQGDSFMVFATKSGEDVNETSKLAADVSLHQAADPLPRQPLTFLEWAAVGVLMILGGMYVSLKIWRIRSEE